MISEYDFASETMIINCSLQETSFRFRNYNLKLSLELRFRSLDQFATTEVAGEMIVTAHLANLTNLLAKKNLLLSHFNII